MTTPSHAHELWRAIVRALSCLLLFTLLGPFSGCGAPPPPAEPESRPLVPDENTRFHVNDRLGSSALVLDYQGNVIARASPEPFGASWVDEREVGAHAPVHRFAGGEDDPLSAGVSIGVRQYLPQLGRWASPDPLFLQDPGEHLEHPGERNLYRYAANNPINHTDPTGTSVWTKLAKIAGKLLNGASAASAVAGIVDDVETLADPNESTVNRVIAGASLASEVLPVSIGDARDVYRWAKGGANAADGAVDVGRATQRARRTPSTGGSSTRPSQSHIVTESGTVLPANKDVNLVDTRTPTNQGGDWMQIHRTHDHGGMNPHTHFPERHQQRTVRRSRETTASDIDRADASVRSGDMRGRTNRRDKGGPS